MKKKMLVGLLFLGVNFVAYADDSTNPYGFFGGGSDSNASSTSNTAATANSNSNSAAQTASASASATQSASAPARTASGPQYQTPAPLAQPASSVGQFSPSSAASPSSLKLLPNPALTSSSPSPIFPPPPGSVSAPSSSQRLTLPPTAPTGYPTTPGLNQSSASSSNAVFTPTSDNSGGGSGILQQINANIQLGNSQFLAEFEPNQQAVSSNFLSSESGYSNILAIMQSTNPIPAVSTSVNSDTIRAAQQGLAALIASSSTSGTSNLAALQQSINAPFSGNWMSDVSVATTPQLLRMIAVQEAIQNYIAYQELQRLMETEALQVAMVQSVNGMSSQLVSVTQSNGYYLAQILSAIKTQNNKKGGG